MECAVATRSLTMKQLVLLSLALVALTEGFFIDPFGSYGSYGSHFGGGFGGGFHGLGGFGGGFGSLGYGGLFPSFPVHHTHTVQPIVQPIIIKPPEEEEPPPEPKVEVHVHGAPHEPHPPEPHPPAPHVHVIHV